MIPQFDSYGFYVWAVYAIACVSLGALWLVTWIQYKAAKNGDKYESQT